MSSAPVAIVGAGVAGLACAHALQERGRAVVLFDKGRGPGGRTATRRAGDARGRGWDHGAPAFSAEGAGFRAAVASWEAAGIVAPWEVPDEVLWTAVPGMSALCRRLSTGLPMLQGMKVLGLHRGGDGWSVQAEDRHAGPFSTVVLTSPAPQAVSLIGDRSASLVKKLGKIRYAPCWTLLAETAAAEPVPLRRAANGGLPDCVETVICEGSKPGREAPWHGRRWTVHGRADWSAALLDADPATPGHELTIALESILEVPVSRGYTHLWHMAWVAAGLASPYLRDADAGLAWAGDGCMPKGMPSGIEAAWTSGNALGKAL